MLPTPAFLRGGVPCTDAGADTADLRPRSDDIAAAADQNEHRINERIRAREVRLIDPDGKQLGVKPLPEALAIARRLDLDLVEVAAEANPPVCRIMDFNRFKYEAAQRQKETRRRSTSIKEMKYRPKIGTGDFDTKTRQVARFLNEGHKVKITIMFKGREMSHPELGKKILDHVAESVGPVAKVEAAPKVDGRNMVMVLAPDRRGRAASNQAKAAQARPAGPSNGSAPTNGKGPEAARTDRVQAQPAAVNTAPATAGPPDAAPAPANPASTPNPADAVKAAGSSEKQ